MHSRVTADLYALVRGSGVVSQTLLLMKHGGASPNRPPSITSETPAGLWVKMGRQRHQLNDVNGSCMMSVTVTHSVGGLRSSSLVSKNLRTSSLWEMWEGSFIRACGGKKGRDAGTGYVLRARWNGCLNFQQRSFPGLDDSGCVIVVCGA